MSAILLSLVLLLFPLALHAGTVAQYRAGSITFLAHRYGDTGTAWRATLQMGIHHIPPADEYTLDFWLKYREGWIEGAGGKIAGFGGGTVTSGCRPIHVGGWSLRIMWSPLLAYLYHQDRRARCGDNDPFQPSTLRVGQWHRLTQRVRINTPNLPNGIYQIWVNGQQTYYRTNLRLRGKVSPDSARIDRVFVHPFRGGDDPEWAVGQDTTIDFSPFYVLDCVPAFGDGSPTTPPRCRRAGDPSAPPAQEPVPEAPPTAAPKNLRIISQ